VVLGALIVVGLLVYAVLDCVQTPTEELRVARSLWLTLIVLVPVLGPVAWLLTGRIQVPRHARADPSVEPAPRPARPVGPDDDPEFLAGMGRAQPPKPPEPIDPDSAA
jgi:phospholipase D-like protein